MSRVESGISKTVSSEQNETLRGQTYTAEGPARATVSLVYPAHQLLDHLMISSESKRGRKASKLVLLLNLSLLQECTGPLSQGASED